MTNTAGNGYETSSESVCEEIDWDVGGGCKHSFLIMICRPVTSNGHESLSARLAFSSLR